MPQKSVKETFPVSSTWFFEISTPKLSQKDMLSTFNTKCKLASHFQILLPDYMLKKQQTLKENGFKIIKSMRNNTCHYSICKKLFRASQKCCQTSKYHNLLAWYDKLVLKLMLVPGFQKSLKENSPSIGRVNPFRPVPQEKKMTFLLISC